LRYRWSKRVVTLALISLLTMSCSSSKQRVGRNEADEALGKGEVIVDIKKEPGSDTRLGKVIGVIEAPRERVWKVISDYNEHKKFMPNLIECFAIRPEGLELLEGASPKELSRLESQLRGFKSHESPGGIVYTYSVGDFPWPMPNKRYVLRVERDQYRFTTRANMVLGEMKVNESSWELKPYGSDASRTLATYTVHLDPGTAVPGFAVNMAAKSTLPGVIEAVRRRVKNSGYGS
jgi:uncharacterized protein YndB with AHSA1/START domain